ncbi:MAG: hypothetical protein K9N49_09565 [Candidatus Marinimicrobia bacterium]|nr:hypothetical protein [Candidatus Neomarinimicrobiota bacterium]
MDSMMLFAFWVVLGVGLILAEVFVPGGVLGTLGGGALILAIVSAFSVFGPEGGVLALLLIVCLVGVVLFIGVRLFPKSPAGRRLSLKRNGADFKVMDVAGDLLGQTGQAVTDLRPGGIALFAGRRVDVVADGQWIPKDSAVVIVTARGSHVTVRPASPPAGGAA